MPETDKLIRKKETLLTRRRKRSKKNSLMIWKYVLECKQANNSLLENIQQKKMMKTLEDLHS
jgi:hypothetical protein